MSASAASYLGRPGFRRDRGEVARGVAGWHYVLVLALVAPLLAGVIWLSWRHAGAELGEQELQIPMICGDCRHVFDATYQQLQDLIKTARARGAAGAGEDLNAPTGVCPKCGKLSVYRAGRDPGTGELTLPDALRIGSPEAPHHETVH